MKKKTKSAASNSTLSYPVVARWAEARQLPAAKGIESIDG